jgi:uncharacterized membrane protein YccC
MFKEFEWMGFAFALFMCFFFVLGMLSVNYFVMAFSLICAVCSGILLDGYPSGLRGESFG